MISLGVTGGIGSGKSAAVAHLAARPGVRVLRADDEAKRLMADDADLRAALVARFGPDTYGADGRLDRSRLAARVFADADELSALNAIVHPAVRRSLEAALESARADGVRLFVYEAALLFDIGGEGRLDATLLVDAPPDLRVARAAARDGVPPEAVRDRMRNQIDPAEARRRATFVIDNAGSLADLHAAVDAVADRLLGAGDAG